MEASEDVTAGQLLKIDGDGTVGVAGDEDNILGVAYNDEVAGDNVAVVTGVEVNLIASAAITAGARLASAAGNKVKTFVEGTDAENHCLGRALTSAAVDGDEIRAYIY